MKREGVGDAKRRLRRELRAARAALAPEERAARSAAIVSHLADLPQLADCNVIAAFAATPSEVNLDRWLEVLLNRRITVALPMVRGAEVALAAPADLASLVPGWRGVREPPPGSPAVDVNAVQAAVVPGLAFDPAGHRLGQGGGHLDRLLAACPPDCITVGVAFGLQIVPVVPTEDHDVAVDLVVTEAGVVDSR